MESVISSTSGEWKLRWSRCVAALEAASQADGCFFSTSDVREALLSSEIAASVTELDRAMEYVRSLPGGRYTVYQVEELAVLLVKRPTVDDLVHAIMASLDPSETGVVYTAQLNSVLRRFGLYLSSSGAANSQDNKSTDDTENAPPRTLSREYIRSIIMESPSFKK